MSSQDIMRGRLSMDVEEILKTFDNLFTYVPRFLRHILGNSFDKIFVNILGYPPTRVFTLKTGEKVGATN